MLNVLIWDVTSSRCQDAEMPDDVPLVTFVVDGAGQWPRRPTPAQERRNWLICQGNDVDADSERDAAFHSLSLAGRRSDSVLVNKFVL